MVQNFNIVATIIQIITNVFVMIGGIIAIWQYLLSVKNTKKAWEKDLEIHEKGIYQRDREKIVNAIELTKYYKDEILPLMREVKKIYTTIGIYDIVQSIDKNLMINFDIVELEKNLNKSQINQIRDLGAVYRIDTAMKEKGIAYNISYREETATCESDEIEQKSNKSKESEDYAQMVINVLNSLEYFSMHFVHNTADHTVVYQPLHMTFLEVVRMLYYNISSVNIKGEQKFFINTITLFRKWNKMSIEQEEKENDAMRAAANIGNILKDNENIDIGDELL